MEELLLVWRRPSSDSSNRRRYVIGRLAKSVNDDKDRYIFRYSDEFDEARKVGLEYFAGFDGEESKKFESNELFPSVLNRLPSRDRNNYLEILNLYGLDRNAREWEILKATKGRLLTDNFEFVPAFDQEKIEFDVAGMRHRKIDIKKMKKDLRVDAKILLEPELGNKYDEDAIKVILPVKDKRYHIGYVPRYYSGDLAKYVKSDRKYSALVSRVDMNTKNHDEKVVVKVRLLFDK